MCYTPSSGRCNFFQLNKDYWLIDFENPMRHRCTVWTENCSYCYSNRWYLLLGFARKLPSFIFVKGFLRVTYVAIGLLHCCIYDTLSIHKTSNPTAIFPLYEMSVITFHCFTYFRTEEWWTGVTNTQARRVPSGLHWFYRYWLGVGVNLLVISHTVR